MTSIDYVRGEHFAIASGETVALCDGAAPAGISKRLYDAFLGARGAAAVMRSILALDLGEVSSLAVVTRGEGRWHVLVRGSGRVEVRHGDDTALIAEPEVLTWSETTVTDADGFHLAFSAKEPQGERFPSEGGVVAAERVFLPVAGGPIEWTTTSRTEAKPEVAADRAQQESLTDEETETAVVEVVASNELPAADDAPAREIETVGAAKIVLSNGRVVELDRPVLLGRAPRAAAVQTTSRPALVTVPRASADVSRTHLLIEFEDGAVAVTDTGSRNGTLVTRLDCATVRLSPGERMLVDRGTRLELGEGAYAIVEASR